jgi:hypothetical protein
MTPRPSNPPPPPHPPKSLLRNLGEFFGHIAEGIKRPAGEVPATPSVENPPPPKIVREQVEEREVHTPQGKLVLRRRIIDEVEPPQV